VGIDLHKSTFNAAVVDDDGNLLRETKGKCEPDELRRFSGSLPQGIHRDDGELIYMVLGIPGAFTEARGGALQSREDEGDSIRQGQDR
jgi:predicted NBD/HSP70 family sugar kinase